MNKPFSPKVASTHEVIEKLTAFETLYGVSAITSISSVCNGNRTTEFIFHVEDAKGEHYADIEIASIRQDELLKGGNKNED